jgi:hypothetical protein
MPPRFPQKSSVINWLKALMLSPGILFPTGYLLLYLATNIYLNAEFKKDLSLSVSNATGNTWQINITSLKSGWALDSVTLNHIELIKTATLNNRETVPNSTITIKSIDIPFPNLEKLLFSSAERVLSTDTFCKKILAEKHSTQ